MGDKASGEPAAAAAATDDAGAGLSELLDSALADFAPPQQQQTAAKGEPAASDTGAECAADGADADPSAYMTQEVAQRAARDFHNMLSQLAKVQEAAVGGGAQEAPAGAAADGAAAAGDGDDAPPVDPQRLLQDLQQLSAKAGEVASASDAHAFQRSMNELHSAGFENDLMPFMHGLMTSLMSKEVMYPSVSDMSRQLPEWLERNAGALPEADRRRYERMLGIMRAVCKEYEEETDDETDEARASRSERLMLLMGRLQMCGQPPAELIGELPAGWQVDPDSGMPHVVDTQSAAQDCRLM